MAKIFAHLLISFALPLLESLSVYFFPIFSYINTWRKMLAERMLNKYLECYEQLSCMYVRKPCVPLGKKEVKIRNNEYAVQ